MAIAPAIEALPNHTRQSILAEGSLYPLHSNLHSTRATATAGKKSRIVNFERNANPAEIPTRLSGRLVGLSSHVAKAKNKANCIHEVGKPLYSSPAKARTIGSVLNSAGSSTPARS